MKLRLAAALTLGVMASNPVIASVLFADSFETGDLSSSNSEGFSWGGQTSTLITVESTSPSLKLTENESSTNISPTAISGNHSLRFPYRAGSNWVEKRFSFGEAHPEFWMSFWLRVPTNFTHPSDSPTNQKLFRVWMDGYNQKGEGSTVGMSFRNDGNGGSRFFVKIGEGDYHSVGGDGGKTQFITIPRDRGRWMKLVVHVKSESQPDADDGLMEVWRKWQNEKEYTKTHYFPNQPIKLSSTVKGFSQGYLMGWANAAYNEDTVFYIDNFKLSTTPLFSDSITNPPKAPANLVIK